MDITYTKKFATEMAIGSFAIGTLLFLFFMLMQQQSEILLLGFLYVFFAGIINSIMVLYLVYGFFRYPSERQEIAIRILLLLSNIPIAALYLFVIIKFNTISPF